MPAGRETVGGRAGAGADDRAGHPDPAREGVQPEEAVLTEPTEPESPGEWSFMIDPAWAPAVEGEEPPFEAVVGGWFIGTDGSTSLFRPNPSYVPSRPDLPRDPVDVTLQLLAKEERDADDLLVALGEVLLGVAVDEQGMALVAPAPDDVPSVLVATAPAHRARVDAPAWREVTVAELAAALPPEGVDVLLNPGAPTSVRLTAGAVRDSHRAHSSAEDRLRSNRTEGKR